MGRKVVLGALGVLIAIYFVTAPSAAAATIRHVGAWIGHFVHQLSIFLQSL